MAGILQNITDTAQFKLYVPPGLKNMFIFSPAWNSRTVTIMVSSEKDGTYVPLEGFSYTQNSGSNTYGGKWFRADVSNNVFSGIAIHFTDAEISGMPHEYRRLPA